MRRMARSTGISVQEQGDEIQIMKTKLLRIFAVALGTVLVSSGLNAQSLPRLKPIPQRRTMHTRLAAVGVDPSPWTPLTNQPTFLASGAANPILLTDGTVLVQDAGVQDWWRLTPDQNGSYMNGSWTQIASLPTGYSPLYHSSAVLPDGRLIIEGGEYNFFVPSWTNLGAIYDPLLNTWTSVAPPPFFGGFSQRFSHTIGDAQSVVLFDGTYTQANCCTREEALLDPKTLTWTATGTGKFDIHDEEGWTLLPNKQLLTVDACVFQYDATGTNSEI